MGGTLRMDIGGRSNRGQDANRARHCHRTATESSLARQSSQSVGQRRVASAGGVVFSWPGWLPPQGYSPNRLRMRVGDLAHGGAPGPREGASIWRISATIRSIPARALICSRRGARATPGYSRSRPRGARREMSLSAIASPCRAPSSMASSSSCARRRRSTRLRLIRRVASL